MDALKKIARFYDKIERHILILSFFVTVALVAIQVVMRYVFNSSLSWSEELTRYIFVWQVWMCTSLACKNNNHIRVEILLMFLKGKAKDVYFLLGDIIVLLFTLFLVYDGFIVTNRMALRGLLTPAMQIPLYTMYISLPLGSLCVSIRLFVRVINELRALAGQVPAVGKEA